MDILVAGFHRASPSTALDKVCSFFLNAFIVPSGRLLVKGLSDKICVSLTAYDRMHSYDACVKIL